MERVAIPVNSPEVYSPSARGEAGDVVGGCADQLARQLIKTIQDAYVDSENLNLKAAWQRTSCDGQYQAQEFHSTLHKELGILVDPTFSAIIWDPSHWINLAILDIRDDKVGSSGGFLKRLVSC